MQSYLICNITAISKIIISFIFSIIIVPIIYLLKCVNFKIGKIRCFYMRGILRIIRVKIIVKGKLSKSRPLLIASNHLSYIDILAYGSLAPIEFVSKKEVSNWPLIGFLAKLAGTVFIDRRRARTLTARNEMNKKLSEGNILLFFPEATSNNGIHILPFKSSLFEVVSNISYSKVTLQPAAIAFTHINELPIGFGWKSLFSWYGEIDFLKHLWNFLKLGLTTIEIRFLEPIKDGQSTDRKLLTSITENSVKNGMSDILSARKV